MHGHVANGTSYTQPITPNLDFKLEAVRAGWVIRVLPHGLARPPHDYAELANPPYHSPTPLLVTTDFAFRAQDAIAWNPRQFRYFTDAKSVRIAESTYERLERGSNRADAAPLLQLLSSAKEATLTILDADIAGGTANQTAAAARVASHLAQTAHRIQTDPEPTGLGRLLGLTFQVSLPAGACPPLLRH